MTNLRCIRALSLTGMFFTLLPTQAPAFDGISANASVTSNDLWRGLEQTNGKAAVSGGLDFEHDSGFYLGTWASNADWDEGMTYELDVYGGYSGSSQGFTYDIGFIQYAYPDATNDVDFSEIYTSISYGLFTFGYATLVNADGADFGDDSYLSVDAEIAVTDKYQLAFHIGKGTDDFYAGEDFIDYGLSLSKSNFTIGASKTNLSDDDVKLYVSYSFDI